MLNFLDDSRAQAGFADAERQVRPRHGLPGQQAPEGGVLAQLLRRAAGIAGAPVDAVLIERRMLEEGAVAASDFLGTSPEEAAEMWGAFEGVPLRVVEAFLGLCMPNAGASVVAPPSAPQASVGAPRSVAPHRPQAPGPVPCRPVGPQGPDSSAVARAALRLCTAARASGRLPEPPVLADAISSLARADEGAFGPPSHAPRRALTLARASPGGGGPAGMAEQAVWLEFCGWKASASGYASAVRLYGHVALFCQVPPWPPSQGVLDAYISLFRSAATLARYLSHLRTVLVWLRCPVGPLADTSRVVRGAEKAGRAARKPRVRASAADTKSLAKWCYANGFRDVGESFVVARQFCLRYGEVIQLGSGMAPVSVQAQDGERKVVDVTFMRRKCYSEPVVVSRRCICSLQGKTLCGVCLVAARCSSEATVVFPGLTYPLGLATLKLAAQACGFEGAEAWGTHAFRRGWATECLQANGPEALFYSGGWRGVTAFAYASAQARGSLAAAEFLIEHSESSEAGE